MHIYVVMNICLHYTVYTSLYNAFSNELFTPDIKLILTPLLFSPLHSSQSLTPSVDLSLSPSLSILSFCLFIRANYVDKSKQNSATVVAEEGRCRYIKKGKAKFVIALVLSVFSPFRWILCVLPNTNEFY